VALAKEQADFWKGEAREAQAQTAKLEARYANFVRVICESSEDKVMAIRKTLMADVHCWASVKDIREEGVHRGLCRDADRAAAYQGARWIAPIPVLKGFLGEGDLLAVSAVSTVLRTTLAETCGKHVCSNYADRLLADRSLANCRRNESALARCQEDLDVCLERLDDDDLRLVQDDKIYHIFPSDAEETGEIGAHISLTIVDTTITNKLHEHTDEYPVQVSFGDGHTGHVDGYYLVEGPCQCRQCHAVHGVGEVGDSALYMDEDGEEIIQM
jgi:hypothetical protein